MVQSRNELIEQVRKKALSNLNASEYEIDLWKHRPYLMDGITVAEFWDHVDKAPAVRIVGDYDVDGVCATYIMIRAIQVIFPQKIIKARIPRRFSEGYGLSRAIADEIYQKDEKGTLIITVDNGIAAGALLEELESNGYPVIVTDHHQLGKATMPNVRMVIDPKVDPLLFTGDYWCGAAVAYKLAEQFISDATIRMELESYAAIATIADCVPLREGNWAMVRRVLSYFRKGKAPMQLSLLSEMLGKEIRFCNEETIGYYLGPAINSLGRLNDNGGTQALSYFLTPQINKAKYIVNTNNARKSLRDTEYEMVLSYIKEHNLENSSPIWVEIPNLHLGIVGILAGNVVEDFGVPAIVLTEVEGGIYKGSARSIDGVDIFKYLINCPVKYDKVGGHAGAAGLTISPEEYEKACTCEIPKTEKKKVDYIEIAVEDIPYVYEELSKYAPFGEGNSAQMFAVSVKMSDSRIRMVGSNGEHFIMTSDESDLSWKVTHFNHIPNQLDDPFRFCIVGNIIATAFCDVETPTLNGVEVFNIEEKRKGGHGFEKYEQQERG